jgi:hypothetical protein
VFSDQLDVGSGFITTSKVPLTIPKWYNEIQCLEQRPGDWRRIYCIVQVVTRTLAACYRIDIESVFYNNKSSNSKTKTTPTPERLFVSEKTQKRKNFRQKWLIAMYTTQMLSFVCWNLKACRDIVTRTGLSIPSRFNIKFKLSDLSVLNYLIVYIHLLTSDACHEIANSSRKCDENSRVVKLA